jgi:tetratricopeptide (TPR) repeat protein
VREHPLGVGLGGFSAVYPAYHRRAVIDPLFSTHTQLDFAHDDYLQVLAELGIGGAALVAALIFSAVRLALQARRKGGRGPEAIIAAASVASTAGLLADAVFSFPLYRALPPWLLAVDAAALALVARGEAPACGFLLSRPVWRRGLAMATSVAVVFLAVAQSRWLRADAHMAKARRAEAAGDWATVAEEGAAAAKLDAARADAWFSLGTAAFVTGRPADAAVALKQAAARDPFNPNTLANLGFARSNAGDRSGAAAALRRAVHVAPGEGEAAYQLGVLLQEAGDTAGALDAFRKAATAWPTDPRPQFRRGLLALRTRQLAEAEEALRAASTLDPHSAGTHKALGVALLEGGRRKDAALAFQQALLIDATITDRPMMERVIADAARDPAPR